MNKKYLCRIALCVFATIVSACSRDEFVEEQISNNQITMTASDFQYENGTRTSIDITTNGGKFTWAANDTVGIFPDEGTQVAFPMSAGAGTQTASFNGGGWALKPSSTYAAYYPFIGNFYIDKKKLPVSFEGQIQNGNGSTAHLGDYDYMVAKATSPQNGNVAFNFKHLGCLIELQIPMNNCSATSIINLVAEDSSFVKKGEVDLTDDNPQILPLIKTNTLSVKVSDFQLNPSVKEGKVYFMICPTNLEGKSLKAEYYDNKGKKISTILKSTNFLAGKAYHLSADLTSSYTIEYTSSDSKIVRPIENAYFGANIISNTYTNGKGIIKFSAPVTSIGRYAFENTNINTITLPEGITTIGEFAFMDTNLKSIELPSTLEYLEEGAFSHTRIKEITIPQNVKRITRPFVQCNDLERFYGKFSSADHHWLIQNDTIKGVAISGLNKICTPNGVRVIDDWAFSKCQTLTNISFNNELESIGKSCFAYCHQLTQVNLPNNLRYIGNNAFGDTGIKNLTIPDKVDTLESIIDCTYIDTLTIGKAVKVFKGFVWHLNGNPCVIISKAEIPPICTRKLSEDVRQVFVPNKSYNAYKSSSYWNEIRISPCEEVTKNIYVSTPGTLSQLIKDDEKFLVTNLTLHGELNEDDFCFIKDISEPYPYRGNLKTLNLVDTSSYGTLYLASDSYIESIAVGNSQYVAYWGIENLRKVIDVAYAFQMSLGSSSKVKELYIDTLFELDGGNSSLEKLYILHFWDMTRKVEIPSSCKIYVNDWEMWDYKNSPVWQPYLNQLIPIRNMNDYFKLY